MQYTFNSIDENILLREWLKSSIDSFQNREAAEMERRREWERRENERRALEEAELAKRRQLEKERLELERQEEERRERERYFFWESWRIILTTKTYICRDVVSNGIFFLVIPKFYAKHAYSLESTVDYAILNQLKQN